MSSIDNLSLFLLRSLHSTHNPSLAYWICWDSSVLSLKSPQNPSPIATNLKNEAALEKRYESIAAHRYRALLTVRSDATLQLLRAATIYETETVDDGSTSRPTSRLGRFRHYSSSFPKSCSSLHILICPFMLFRSQSILAPLVPRSVNGRPKQKRKK